jgi:hypothetical protein
MANDDFYTQVTVGGGREVVISSSLPSELLEIEQTTARAQRLVHEIQALHKAGSLSSGYVKILSTYSYCPVLIDREGKPIFLFRFLETIDEMLDYDKIREEYPTITFAQIDGAMSFLRRLAQTNCNEIDLDSFEDTIIAENFAEELRDALRDQESVRVLNRGEQSGR